MRGMQREAATGPAVPKTVLRRDSTPHPRTKFPPKWRTGFVSRRTCFLRGPLPIIPAGTTVAHDDPVELKPGADCSDLPPEQVQCLWEAGYEARSQVASSGMGVVYDARQLGVGRRVAIKMIHENAASRSARRRLSTRGGGPGSLESRWCCQDIRRPNATRSAVHRHGVFDRRHAGRSRRRWRPESAGVGGDCRRTCADDSLGRMEGA